MDGDKWLIAGLGNPGSEYAKTRHNAGFDVIDLLAEDLSANYWKSDCNSMVAKCKFQGDEVMLAKPMEFMNLSGKPVCALLKKYGIDKEHLIVIHDDLDIPEGSVRIKFSSGHGCQKGVRSIIDTLGSKSFYQVKVGIGRPPGRMPVSSYVLQEPKGDSLDLFVGAVLEAKDLVLFFLENGIQKTQSKFN